MERISRALKTAWRHIRDSRGVSLYEITAAVAMTGILAAVAVPVVLEKVSEAKSARAVQETDSIYRASVNFQRDTGLMPGELEVRATTNASTVLVSSLTAPLPTAGSSGVYTPAGITLNTDGSCATKCLDINTFLVSKPTNAQYGNWRGPYLETIATDPFDRAYIFNVRPLVIPEVAGTNTTGYGWVLSGGPDRRLDTGLDVTRLDSASDDIGKNNGKKITQTQ